MKFHYGRSTVSPCLRKVYTGQVNPCQPCIDETRFGDSCAAILAVLRALGGRSMTAGWVRLYAPMVLQRAGRVSEDATAWGKAVRHLRGRGVLAETYVDGVTMWGLGSDKPELITEGWPDDGARAVVGRKP
jgi:hypothetical protein